MASEMGKVEERLKSFVGQLQTEGGIFERLVYKHKNQHRRCSYFQYILKVRRDLKLLKLANLEDICDSSFLVINGNRPKQKVQLLESLKRRRGGAGKYTFLERLLGVTRLLSQMVEPLLKAAMEISTLLARSFFMKFSLTTLAVLARIRVLVQQCWVGERVCLGGGGGGIGYQSDLMLKFQVLARLWIIPAISSLSQVLAPIIVSLILQMLIDAVLLYNTVSSISRREQTVKLNQEGFEVFREYYPAKEEDSIVLECIWQRDKYVLVERKHKYEANSQEKDVIADVPLTASKIQYENIEVLLGVDEPGTTPADNCLADPISVEEDGDNKKPIENASSTAKPSSETIVSLEDVSANSSVEMIFETIDKLLVEVGLPTSSSKSSPPSCPVKIKQETKKRVAFVSVKPPASWTVNESRPIDMRGREKNEDDKDDPFFSLLTGASKKSRLC
ncbi:hypothetical protein OROHE_010705 [Orobanche hederae]